MRVAKRRFLNAAASLLGLLCIAGLYAADFGSSVVVQDAGSAEVYRYSLPGSGEFGIEYIHSYYEVSATEHFVARRDGSFELVEVSSPSEAVLDYYEIEGRKSVDGEWISLTLDEPRLLEELPLIGTEKGERTLVVSDERLPLYEADGPRHVNIRVEQDAFYSGLRGWFG
ncbi:MAG: hypothetical protein M3122_10525 [Actinomycetota bacterium]|nr:hypothetical protein [Actinomycetota bacterium]